MRVGVQDARGIAAVDERPGDDRGQIELHRNLAQQDEAAVGGQVAAILRGCERLASDG